MMVNTRVRPYWHVDAKWVAGILLVLVLGPTLFLYSLVRVTAEEPAADILTLAIATSFSRKGLDDETEIQEVRRLLQARPGESFQPIPGLRLAVREQDLVGRTPREARLALYRQISVPLYLEGPRGLAALAESPDDGRRIADSVGPIGVVNRETHQMLQSVLLPFAAIAVLLAVLLVVFSYRFGRIFSLGLAVVIAALPGVAVFGFLGFAQANSDRMPAPAPEAGMAAMADYFAANVLPPIVEVFWQVFATALLVGAGLILLATVARVGFARAGRGSPPSAAPMQADNQVG